MKSLCYHWTQVQRKLAQVMPLGGLADAKVNRRIGMNGLMKIKTKVISHLEDKVMEAWWIVTIRLDPVT